MDIDMIQGACDYLALEVPNDSVRLGSPGPFVRSRITQHISHTCFPVFATFPQGILASTLTHLK